MPSLAPDGTAPDGIGEAVRSVAQHASTLARLEARLAKEEFRGKLSRFGLAVGLALAALILALFGLGFTLASASAGLDEVLPTWLSLLIVALAVVALAGALAAAAVVAARRARPPLPERAIGEAKETKRVLGEVTAP
jgi:hypothetical protein